MHGQTAATPRLTMNARLVVLDVVVTDAAGRPVDDLGMKDFQLFEDGKLMQIRSVEPPSSHLLPGNTSSADAEFDPAKPERFGSSPVNVLVLDQLNTHFADSAFARRALHDYLAAQPAVLRQPTAFLAVHDDHFESLAGFTRDRDKLLAALAATPTKYAWKLELNGRTEHGPLERLDQSLSALEEMAQSFARIPGRKNIVWVGGGFPTVDPVALEASDAKEIHRTLHHVTNLMLETRMTLYAVDPTSSAPGMTEVTDASQMAFIMAVGEANSGSVADPFNASEDFDRLGPATGGRVVRGRNDVAQQIASAVDVGSQFYTISYAPEAATEAAAHYRRIRVVCLRPALTATTRSGYYAGLAGDVRSSSTEGSELAEAAESPLAFHALSVSVERGAEVDTYRIRVGAANLTWKTEADGRATASVAILAASLNGKSKMVGHTLRGMTATARPGTDLRDSARTAEFAFSVQRMAKAESLRFVVRDTISGRMGTVDLPAGSQ